MPWHIESDNSECDGWAVVKDDDGSIAGCHETEEKAKAQMAALYASEKQATVIPDDEHYQQMAALDKVAVAMIERFNASGTRHAKRLVQLVEVLRSWQADILTFFHEGFASGRLEHSEHFPPEYVLAEILDLVQNDLSIFDRVDCQRMMASPELIGTLDRAEILAQLSLEPAYNAGWLDPIWVMSILNDDIAIRPFPYAPVGAVTLPYVGINYPFDSAVIPHEVAHVLWPYAEIESGGVNDVLPQMLKSIPPFVQSWAHETFCDGYASKVFGPATALWFHRLSETAANTRPNRNGAFSYSFDNAKHVPFSLRTLVFAKFMHFMDLPFAGEIYAKWRGTVERRGLPPINTVIGGQMMDIPAEEIVDFSIELNPQKPLDYLILAILKVLDGLETTTPDYIGDAKTLDDVAHNFNKAAINGFGRQVPDYNEIKLRVATWDTLLDAWLPGVDAKNAPLSISQWMELLGTGGWTKGRQHTLIGEFTMSKNVKSFYNRETGQWGEIVDGAFVPSAGPAVGMQPPAVGMQPSVNWNAANHPGMALWSGPAVGMQPGMALWSGPANTHPGMALWSGPAVGMQPSVNWNAANHPGMALWSGPAVGMQPSVNWNAGSVGHGGAQWLGPAVGMQPGMALWSGPAVGMQPGMALWSGPAVGMQPSVNWNAYGRSANPALFTVKKLGGDRVGGYAVLWGNQNARDIDGEWFEKDTEELTGVFDTMKKLPYFYDHADDKSVKSTVIGVVDVLRADDIGLWYEAQLNKAGEYREAIEGLISYGMLGTSSGTLPMARRVEKSGRIARWPIVEISATPTPADPRQAMHRPITDIKSAFGNIGLKFELGDKTGGTKADSASASTVSKSTFWASCNPAEVERLRLELELMEMGG